MNLNSNKVMVTGGSGMLGHALSKYIPEAIFLSSNDCDLTSQPSCKKLFEDIQPEYVIHLAARVGGVKANNDFLGDFYRENVLINTNVLESSREYGVKKVLSMLSTCIYPDKVNYPLTEEQIHNGEPHQSNYAYAFAKRMLDVQSRAYRDQFGCNYITAVANNLFGENDNYHKDHSHVIPGMIRKMYEAKLNNGSVTLWSDGTPIREFTYSQDMAKIILFLMKNYEDKYPINIGNTQQVSILEIANKIADFIGFDGDVIWDTSKPKGQHKKPSDNSKLINLGWNQGDYTDLDFALQKSINWFTKNYSNYRGNI